MRLHQTIAFRTAWVITRSAADAEEAAQDGFVKAHAALPRFREGSPFRPWLLAIVANEARNRVRAAGRPCASRSAWSRSAARTTRSRRPRRRSSTPSSASFCSPRSSACPQPAREAIACRYLLELTRGGDGRRARLPARHRQVAALARARAAARGAGGGGGMSELEQRLTQLGRELDWPETPDLAPAVRQRLASPRPRPHAAGGVRSSSAGPWRSRSPRCSCSPAASSPLSRACATRCSSSSGSRARRSSGSRSIPDAPELRPLQLGQRTTLERARDELGFTPLLPSAAGGPTASS